MWVLYLNDEPNIQAQFSRTACIFNDGLEISISLSKECNIQSIQSNLAWSDILLLNDITYKKILRYIIQSKVQTVEAITWSAGPEGRNVLCEMLPKRCSLSKERPGKIANRKRANAPCPPFALNFSSALPTTWKSNSNDVVPNKEKNQIIAMWFHSEILRET